MLPAPGPQAPWLCSPKPMAPSLQLPGGFWVLSLQMTLAISRCNPHVAATCSGPSNDDSLPLAGPICIHRGSKRPAFPGPYTRIPERSPPEAVRAPGQRALPPPYNFTGSRAGLSSRPLPWAGRASLIPSLDAATGCV